jgi:hypothetical protein
VTNDGSGGDTGGFVGENYYLMGTAVATTATSYEVGTVTASYGTCSGEYVGAGATDKGYMSGLNTYAYYDNTNNYNSLPGAGCPSGDSGISELPSSGCQAVSALQSGAGHRVLIADTPIYCMCRQGRPAKVPNRSSESKKQRDKSGQVPQPDDLSTFLGFVHVRRARTRSSLPIASA